MGARTDGADTVRGRVRSRGLARTMPVGDGVERIVVAVEEVPTGDVVDVAVVVVVDL